MFARTAGSSVKTAAAVSSQEVSKARKNTKYSAKNPGAQGRKLKADSYKLIAVSY
jgi:hypothetical protein